MKTYDENSITIRECDNDTNNNWFKNLTDSDIPKNVIDVLALGNKYNVNNSLDNKSIISNNKINEYLANDIRYKLINNANHFIKKTKHISIDDRLIAKKSSDTKKFLKDNDNVIFTHADKGTVKDKDIYHGRYEKI